MCSLASVLSEQIERGGAAARVATDHPILVRHAGGPDEARALHLPRRQRGSGGASEAPAGPPSTAKEPSKI